MIRYKNISKNSGVSAYEIGIDYIIVQFIDNRKYRYTYQSAGKDNIEEMKKRAEVGKGLSTFISTTIREKFASKLE